MARRRVLLACAALAARHAFAPPPRCAHNASQHRAHNAYQAQVFDEQSGFFASPAATPPSVAPKLRRIAESCRLTRESSVLDVGTGTGALLPFFREQGTELRKVTGVDLSKGMLSFARERHAG